MKEFAYIPEDGARPAALQAVPFLNSFSDEQLDDVLNSSNLLQCDVGDAIIKEGTIDSRFYILLSGQLEVRVGNKPVASITRAGEVFGELALVNHDKRLASVVAASKAVCLAVDQKFLQDIHPRDEDPAFHASLFEFVARLIAKKLDSTSRRLAELEKELVAIQAQAPAKAKAKAPKPAKAVKAKAVKAKAVKTVAKAVKGKPVKKPVRPMASKAKAPSKLARKAKKVAKRKR
ncbi:MAG: cyclic nucleotide-binding domain-containing protein [Verrucomicrobiaceae bacterium]|nr:cyclic nucleotide-binding domain-containing protein [Verrucomicrobiaceae bacterium]